MKRLFLLCFLISFCFPLMAGNIRMPDITFPPHPRLLLLQGEEQALMQSIGQDSVWNLFQQRAIEACDRLLPRPPLEKVKTGRRMLGTSREALYRIFMLSYAYRTTNKGKYASRAMQEMVHIARYDDWNPEHFLDVAEMTMALSIGYDWLYHSLTPAARKEIKSAILQKGLRPSLDKRYNSFLEKTNNWNQVCNTAMAYGAIALMEEEEALCKEILRRSVEEIRKPMRCYGPDGAYPEGYGYWHYGTTYNVMLLAALRALYGTDFGLSDIPGFRKGANYILHMVGPTGLPFNFGDSGGKMRLNTSLFWFARQANDPSLLRYERRQLLETKNYDYEEYRRMLPSIFILGHGLKMAHLPEPKETLFAARNEAPVCLMRTGWNSKEAVYVAIKGGSASANTHTHLDAGSFVMDALGVRWAVDLGPQDYNSLESKDIDLWDNGPGSKRWSVYRYNNLAHNVFSIDNELFPTEGRGILVSYIDSTNHKEATFDLTSLYKSLDKAERRISLDRKKEVTIEDRVVNGNTPSSLTWRMLTPADVEPADKGFTLRRKGKTLHVELPAGVTPFAEEATPQADYDEKNPGITIIGFKTNLLPGSNVTLKVKLIPESL